MANQKGEKIMSNHDDVIDVQTTKEQITAARQALDLFVRTTRNITLVASSSGNQHGLTYDDHRMFDSAFESIKVVFDDVEKYVK